MSHAYVVNHAASYFSTKRTIFTHSISDQRFIIILPYKVTACCTVTDINTNILLTITKFSAKTQEKI